MGSRHLTHLELGRSHHGSVVAGGVLLATDHDAAVVAEVDADSDPRLMIHHYPAEPVRR